MRTRFPLSTVRADTDEHRKIMQEIGQLRVYADFKRMLTGPTKKQA
jgi:hypothetical protein